MKVTYGASALPTVALGLLICTGCGTANEEALKGESKVVPQRSDVPNFKSYGEAVQYQTQQSAKNKGAKPKAAPKEEPAPSKEKPE
jgi:hypothetical protein